MTRPAEGALTEEARSLVAIIDWLAGLFSAPMSKASLAACRSAEGTALLAAIGDETGSVRGIDLMRSALGVAEDTRTLTHRLEQAYTLLFEGPGGPKTVSLYESVYSSDGPRLFRSATGEMEAMLRSAVLATRAGPGEPADHLSIELALLAALLRAGDGVEAGALRDRLQRWIPRLCESCNEADATGFYGGASMLLHDLLNRLAPRARILATASSFPHEEHHG